MTLALRCAALERRLDALERRLDTTTLALADLQARVTAVEQRVRAALDQMDRNLAALEVTSAELLYSMSPTPTRKDN